MNQMVAKIKTPPGSYCPWRRKTMIRKKGTEHNTASATRKADNLIMGCSAARLDEDSHQHHHGVLDQRLEGADQDGAERAVDGAVIARQRHAHDVGGFDLAVTHHRALFAAADRKDGGVRRIDHGGE